MRNIVSICLSFFVFCIMPAVSVAAPLDDLKEQYKRPLQIPFPKDALYNPQAATLGKMLFFDPRLSREENLNCASCHNPSFGYEVPLKTPIGRKMTALARQAPTILNVAWGKSFFWDGRAKTLEDQAVGPITADVEMGGKFEDIIARLEKVKKYKQWFNELYPGTGITRKNILSAIATYERTIVTEWAPFDRWIEGDEKAISKAAKRGFEIFNGKGHCSKCHMGWNFTDDKFHDIGVDTNDIGRAEFEPANFHANKAFKTPTLRDLSHRAPYMHNGSVATLEGVIELYNRGGANRKSGSPLIRSLSLSRLEKADLVEFLQSLTAKKSNVTMPRLPN